MTLSMYTASIPVFTRALDNLSHILSIGAKDAETRKIEPAVYINARLAPDMLPLARQVQITSDTIKGGAARLASIEIPSYDDAETSFAELEARIEKTRVFLKSITAAQVDGSESKAIELKSRNGNNDRKFNGQDYLTNFVLPNVYFHVTAAYAILRHNGVPLGKKDFLGV